MVIAGLWLGCMEGPNDLTRVTDVRLIAAIADPPAAAAGEPYTLTAVIVEPINRAVDVVIWWCLPAELGPCEVSTPALEDDRATAELIAGLPVPVWIVACVDGVCRDPSEEQLRDPYGWLQELPLVGVTAGSRLVRIREPSDEPRSNPVFTQLPELPATVAVGAEVAFDLVAPGATSVSGVATAGGFGALNQAVEPDGHATLTWYAPSESGAATLYVVVDDGLGGTAVWSGALSVGPSVVSRSR